MRRKGANARFMKLDEMLENVGLSFIGKNHCGIDDARNIVRVLVQIKTDGATPMLNEQFDAVAQQFYSAMLVPKKARASHYNNRYNTPSGDSSGRASDTGRKTPTQDGNWRKTTTTTENGTTANNSKPPSRPNSRQSNQRYSKLPQSKLAEKSSPQTSTPAKTN